MKNLLVIQFFAFACIYCSCGNMNMNKSTQEKEMSMDTIRVKHHLVPCIGSNPQLCLYILKSGSEEWEHLFETIEGFTFNWGYEYLLRVKTIKREKPMEDESYFFYQLEKQLEKKPVDLDKSFEILLKDEEMVYVNTIGPGKFDLMGQFPITCSDIQLQQELKKRLENDEIVIGVFNMSESFNALIINSLRK